MADTASRPAAWIDRLSALVMIAGVAGVVAAGAPILLKANGWIVERSAVAPMRPSLPGHVTSPAPRAPTRPPEAPDPTAPQATELDDPRSSDIARLLERQAGVSRLEDADRAARPMVNERIASVPFALRKEPTRKAPIVARIQAGERISVVREEQGFVLVVHPSERGADIGWAPKEALRGP